MKAVFYRQRESEAKSSLSPSVFKPQSMASGNLEMVSATSISRS